MKEPYWEQNIAGNSEAIQIGNTLRIPEGSLGVFFKRIPEKVSEATHLEKKILKKYLEEFLQKLCEEFVEEENKLPEKILEHYLDQFLVNLFRKSLIKFSNQI